MKYLFFILLCLYSSHSFASLPHSSTGSQELKTIESEEQWWAFLAAPCQNKKEEIIIDHNKFLSPEHRAKLVALGLEMPILKRS
jgi:hypothetical protein